MNHFKNSIIYKKRFVFAEDRETYAIHGMTKVAARVLGVNLALHHDKLCDICSDAVEKIIAAGLTS